MRECNDKHWRCTHSNTGIYWGDKEIPMIEDTCYNWHDSNVIKEGPSQIKFNKQITLIDESN